MKRTGRVQSADHDDVPIAANPFRARKVWRANIAPQPRLLFARKTSYIAAPSSADPRRRREEALVALVLAPGVRPLPRMSIKSAAAPIKGNLP
jgi:hypothetical protein